MLLGWLLAACAGGSDGDSWADTEACTPECADPCDARVNGAFVTLDVSGESFTAWTTNDGFVDTAERHLADGTTQVPVFMQVIAGKDTCADSQWSWYTHPEDVLWADVTIEVCDAVPSFVEANRDAWIDQVGQWCPWSAVVTAVDDRR